MTDSTHNPTGLLEQLFSIIIHLDHELRIEKASAVAMTHMPFLADRPRLTDVFDVIRPKGVTSVEDVLKRGDQLYLLTAQDGTFAIRGQMVSASEGGSKRLIFCGAPWLFWINTNRPELKLGLRDFSAQDSQLDQLFFMTTEKTMVSDLEVLNTQLQEAKAELELAQHARDAFFAQMSHEMRTPLNGVVSALALLEQHRLPEESQELLSLIRSSSTNLMHVINYVLDVSKIEAADGAVEPAPFQLDELVESVLDIVGARALEKGLGLHVRVEPGMPRTFIGDGARMRQALLNLVTNAIKFTVEGDVTVRVASVDSDPHSVRIDVSDTGIGIPEELRERIFEPFFSDSQQGMVAREPGTGLGLDIVRRNVEVMGGEIELTTAPDEGSTFSLLLPLRPVSEPTEARESTPRAEDRTKMLRGSVLLVDDNETNLLLGTMLLEGLGLEVTGAGTGEAAVEAVSKQCFCAVLMDISMPGIGGLEATRQIRALPGRQKLPIVALTAFASSREQERAREAGMNDYLTKPVSQTELAQALRKWLPRSSVVEPAAAAAVDESVLEELAREIGSDNFVRVSETFAREARKRWGDLASATSAVELARQAHSLVSSCRSFGLDAIAEALAGIEAAARQGYLEDSEKLDRLGQRLEESLETLAGWAPGQQCDHSAMKS